MASEKSLTTLLRALQSPAIEQDVTQLLGSAANLLTQLSNPRNLSLLTHQLLCAPALWDRTNGLNTALLVLSSFSSASVHVLNRHIEYIRSDYRFSREAITKEEWTRSIVQGADERTPRWKHLLVLGGLLIGFESQARRGLPPSLRRVLESAVVTATNLALEDELHSSKLAVHSVCLVLAHTFDLINGADASRISHDRLLPILTNALYFSTDGLHWGYMLGTMDTDLVQEANKFNWSAKSTSFFQVKKVLELPLMTVLGALSRIMASSAESVRSLDVFLKFVEDVTIFTRSMCVQWRQNKLCEVDMSEEGSYLHDEALKVTLPVLWQLLKSILFSIVMAQSAVLSRLLGDESIPQHQHIFIATQSLHSIRNLYFITSRFGQNSFSQQNFVYMAALDVLSRYPTQAEAFLHEIGPEETGNIPTHPHSRCNDLYFLNVAEQLVPVLSLSAVENLLVPSATPYTITTDDARLIELFEAAHSVLLAIFSSPSNHPVTLKQLPVYVGTVLDAFPRSLSSRQFRLAIKTLVRVTSPPFRISELQPLLPSTLLEMVRSRSEIASSEILPPLLVQPMLDSEPNVSEQATLVLAMIDSLPVLPLDSVEDWLCFTAEAMHRISDVHFLEKCRQRFWEVLSGGEMDVARSEICVSWWNTSEGRNAIFHVESVAKQEKLTSGTLQMQSKL